MPSSVVRNWRIASFDVDLFSSHPAHTVIHLPKEYILISNSSIPVEETKFKDQGNGFAVAIQGIANEQLQIAINAVIEESIDPFDENDGVRVVAEDDHVAIIARLACIGEYRKLCEKIANAVYDDVFRVEVKCLLPSDRFCLEHRERMHRQAKEQDSI